MMSNNNTPFINELYENYNIHVIKAKRMINSNPLGRGSVEEVIITNYWGNIWIIEKQLIMRMKISL